MVNTENKIAITLGKGFHLSIGQYTISVQIGHSNYCSRRNYSKFGQETDSTIKSLDCEITIWLNDPDNTWVTKKVIKKVLKLRCRDDVMGWITPLQVGQIITWMTKQELKRIKIEEDKENEN